MLVKHILKIKSKTNFTFILILLISFLLSGCLGTIIKTAYRNGDWFVKNEIEKFAELTTYQDDILTVGLETFFKWHKAEELKELAELFKQIEELVEQPTINESDIASVTNHAFQIRDRVAEKFMSETAPVLATANSNQIMKIEVALRDRNEIRVGDDDKTFRERSDQENQEYYLERRVGFLEDWLGKVTPEQRQALIDSPIFEREYSELRQANRENFTQEFIKFLKTRPDETTIYNTLLTWMKKPEIVRLTEYQEALQERRVKFYSSIIFWHSSLTPNQREKLLDELEYYREIIEDLI